MSINFKEILSRVIGNFKEQNKVFVSSIVIINYCLILLYSIQGDKIKAYKISAWESERKRPRRKPSHRLAENKNVDVTKYHVWSSS